MNKLTTTRVGYIEVAAIMRFVVLACVLEALFLRILLLGDLAKHVQETILYVLLAAIFYLISCYLAFQPGNKSVLRVIVLAAVVFRITLWPLVPTLSEDPYRYRWEGKLQAFGGNPYQTRPNDPQWRALRDVTFPLIPGKDFKAVYGPLVEELEFWTYRGVSALEPDPVRQIFWFKLPYAFFDLGVIGVLHFLLRNQGAPPEALVVYAWSPLPILEFWATGHNDSLVVLLVMTALLAASRERWVWAFAALSLATMTKIWPAVLFPLFIGWRRGPRRWYQWSVALPILALLARPYWNNVEENARFLSGFLGGWRNNDSLFGLLLWITGDIHWAKIAAFVIVCGTAAAVTWLGWPVDRGGLAVLTVMLMISANCHPWYLTWILPLLTVRPVPALLLWASVVPLAYSTLISWTVLREWHGSTGFRWYEYAPVYGLLLVGWLPRLRRGKV